MIYPETEQEIRALLKATGCDPDLVDQLDHESLFDAAHEAIGELLES